MQLITVQCHQTVVCVELWSNFTEYLNYFSNNIAFSVILRSNAPEKVRISCVDVGDNFSLLLNESTRFLLSFTNSSLVVIENVFFERCMRPIKLKWVEKIEMVDTLFR